MEQMKRMVARFTCDCTALLKQCNQYNPKSVIVYSNIPYTFAFVNDIKKWNKAVRSFVVKTVSNV